MRRTNGAVLLLGIQGLDHAQRLVGHVGLREDVAAVQGAATALEVQREVLEVLVVVVHVRRE